MDHNVTSGLIEPTPLYLPERDGEHVPPLDIALRLARQTLAAQQPANIHDHSQMINAAVSLESAVRHLLGAFDADEARLVDLPDAWRAQVTA